jgi:hypothetical protein
MTHILSRARDSNSIITLHRLSLIDHPRLVLQNLSHPLLRGRPFLYCLESSESICTQSARAILTTLDASIRVPAKHHYWTFHPVGTAIFALSLFTCKHPTTWQARSDIEVSQNTIAGIVVIFADVNYTGSDALSCDSLYNQGLFGPRTLHPIR